MTATEFTGQQIAGVYRLGHCLGATADGALYETESGEPPTRAVLLLREVDSPQQADQLMSQWSAAQALRHPNLLPLLDLGHSTLADTPVVFAVMEHADETLAGVLRERPLSETETRELLRPAVSALGYLHEAGYVHGALDPDNILAVGDNLKLSSQAIRKATPEHAAAADVFALGGVLVEAFTGHRPQLAGNSSLSGMPDDLAALARHCLDTDPSKRWTIAQVAQHLSSRVSNLAPESPITAPASAPPERTVSQPASWIPAEPAPPNRPRWLWPALAVVALAVLLVFALGRKKENAPPPVTSAAPLSKPAEAAPSVAPPAPARKVASPTRLLRPGWAVVVASYADRGAAEKRARQMGQRWRKFQPSVIDDPSPKALHLVTLGQGLGQEQAAALRKRAVQAGLPRDTYITKY